MACCGKQIDRAKAAAGKGRNIAVGFGRLALGKKCLFTDARIRTCQQCDYKIWKRNGRSLWCSVCHCFVPAKARVENEKCPRGFWKE